MLWPLSVVLVAKTNGRLAIPALAGLLVFMGVGLISGRGYRQVLAHKTVLFSLAFGY